MALIAAVANGIPPSTTGNDDSCEITVAPAATLLLPIFDVSMIGGAGAGDTTLFTITNVSPSPQIAHVTLWTDWAYPVLTFNIFLTGYDVQSINLYDVIARGLVAPGGPGTSSTLNSISPNAALFGTVAYPGSEPGLNNSNPNIADGSVLTNGSCSGTNLPGALPPELTDAVQTVLTTGLYNIAGTRIGCGGKRLGGAHTNARGYVTIDVVTDCTNLFPNNSAYYTSEILFDNVFIGEYQQVRGDAAFGNYAQGNPMVHIRAIPEGGPAGFVPPPGATNLPYTFYDHYTPAYNRKMDRRVPLPSTFAARWIDGGQSAFQTSYKIWREGAAVGAQTTACSGASLNSAMTIDDAIRFDEHENSFGYPAGVICGLPCGPDIPRAPAALIVSTSASLFPPHNASSDVSGWMYLNMDNQPQFGPRQSRPSQNWVIVLMSAQGRYSVDFDAAHLGNGCSAAATVPSPEIGPAGGAFVCPPGITCAGDMKDHPYNGTNVTP